jgi:ABC-type lipoprotein export system ATPase subunit
LVGKLLGDPGHRTARTVPADRGAAVVVATHDPDVVDLCDRVVRLVDGRPQPTRLDEVAGPGP